MKLGRVAAAALLAVGMTSRPAHAWDELGHRVVARIAWDNMTPQARANAVRLLMAAPANTGLQALVPAWVGGDDRGRELFVMAAVWPDEIRSRSHVGNRYAHSDWHYVNFFWEQRTPGGPIVDLADRTDGQLLNQLPGLVRTVGDAQASDSARAVALAWVLHLVGDAHQPLHNSARITPQDTAGDRGGNLFLLGGLYPRNNLHAFWDAIVGPNAQRVGAGDETVYVGGIAGRLETRYRPSWARTRLIPGQFETWSKEGVRLAQRRAYPAWLVRGQPAPDRYNDVVWAEAQPRLALAGYRLADALNRALGGP